MASGCFNRDVLRIYPSYRHEIAREPNRYQARFCQKLRTFHVTDPEIHCWTGFVTWWGGDGFHELGPSGKALWTFQGSKSRADADTWQ